MAARRGANGKRVSAPDYEPRRPIALRAPSPSQAWLGPRFKWLIRNDERRAGVFEPHRHLDYEAIILAKGRYLCAVNGERMELSPGDGVLVKPGDRHEDEFEAGTLYYGLCFCLPALEEGGALELFKRGVAPSGQRFRCETGRVEELLDGIAAESHGRDALSASLQDARLLELLRLIIDALPAGAANPETSGAAKGQETLQARLLRLFSENLDRDLDVSEMSKLLDMSESSLSHSCKKALGMPPRKAFLKAKMEKALQLLADPGLSVKELAWMLGYKDQFVFSRAFKLARGESPDSWRKRHLC